MNTYFGFVEILRNHMNTLFQLGKLSHELRGNNEPSDLQRTNFQSIYNKCIIESGEIDSKGAEFLNRIRSEINAGLHQKITLLEKIEFRDSIEKNLTLLVSDYKEVFVGKQFNSASLPHTHLGENNDEGVKTTSVVENIEYLAGFIKALCFTVRKEFEGVRATPSDAKPKLKLIDIVANEEVLDVCNELLEDLDITVSGICKLTPGKVGKLTGAITAMKECPKFFKTEFTEQQLLEIFNGHLDTDYKTFSKRNKTFVEGYDGAQRYLNTFFKK